MMPPISPMSWNGGTQQTATAPSTSSRCSAARLCIRFPWLSITPRGEPVEPEVYWSRASRLASGVKGSQSSQRSTAIDSSVSVPAPHVLSMVCPAHRRISSHPSTSEA